MHTIYLAYSLLSVIGMFAVSLAGLIILKVMDKLESRNIVNNIIAPVAALIFFYIVYFTKYYMDINRKADYTKIIPIMLLIIVQVMILTVKGNILLSTFFQA